jgi:hypothetical protein
MRKLTLTKDEAGILHTAINQGDPQRGLTLREIRDAIPILDRLELHAKQVRGIHVFEKDVELELKESEYIFVRDKLDNSGSWISVSAGRTVVALADRFAELPALPDSTKDAKK